MNAGDPQQQGGQWSGVPQGQPQTGSFPGQPWGGPGGPYPTGGWGPTPGSTVPRADLAVIFALASSLAGIVTYFMGFLGWISVSAGAEEELNRWGTDFEDGQGGIPAYLSYEIVLNPGKFFIVLGVVGIAATLVLVPRYRKALPFLAVIGAAAWLALFAAALITPPFLDLGAGAIVGLILGFLQVALLMAAAFLYGLKKDDAQPA
ncbi:DUF5336 domain-containing protein [Gordonia sp. 'Campus']|uniref:DUF5336 domain-containing protein n=1 Tax=Gordonia sp. 'Campus' TaxID=2915824 RepID=UPI001EE4E578|nr:DUF5336 domain-containing protein [Gordonia sp. 'Campus']